METTRPSHRKLKNDIMYKFFNEPVDALDLRLTKAEAALSLADPWEEKEAKDYDDSVEGEDDGEDEEGPLDFSEAPAPHSPVDRPSSDISDEYWDDHDNNNEDTGDKYPDLSSDVQFITARSLRSFRNHPYSRTQSLYSPRLNPPPEHLSRLSSKNSEDQCFPSRFVPQEKGISGHSVKKESLTSSPDSLDQKISSIENNSQYSENPLLRRPISSLSGQHASKTLFPASPLPSAAYLARSYQLLHEPDRIKQEWPHGERTLSPFNDVERASVIVGPMSFPGKLSGPAKVPGSSATPSSRQSKLSLHQDWMNSIQQLRERIVHQLHQNQHPPNPQYSHSYQQVLSGYIPSIKSEPEESQELSNQFPKSYHPPPSSNHNLYLSPLLRPPFHSPVFGWGQEYPQYPSRENEKDNEDYYSSDSNPHNKRGRPRKHAPKVPLPPLYVFIRNILHNVHYNPSVISWVDESSGCFKVTSTSELAKTWGRMKQNRSEEMNYEKMSRAMRYHYGSERQGRKGHLAMVKEKRLYYRFGELAINWRKSEMSGKIYPCQQHSLCHSSLCLWTKE